MATFYTDHDRYKAERGKLKSQSVAINAKSMLTVHVNDDILIDMRRSAQDHTPQNAWWKHRDLSSFYRALPELYKCGNEQKSGDNQERTSTQ